MPDHATSTRVADLTTAWVVYERLLRGFAITCVFAIVAYAALGGAGLTTATAKGTNGSISVTVTYASVSRPGIATPFGIEIIAVEGALPDQLVVRVTSDYLTLFDENGLSPEPVESNADGEFEIWTFTPSVDQRTLSISLDARMQPDRHRGENATVRVDAPGQAPVAVSFRTRVSP